MGLPKILDQYRDQQRWTCWAYEDRNSKDGKPAKVPFKPNGYPSKSDNPATWSTYEECRVAVERGMVTHKGDKLCGIGIELYGIEGNLICLDLDKCIDPETRQVNASVMEIVDECASYTEVTPSRLGLRVIGTGIAIKKGRTSFKVKGVGVEIYTPEDKRYLTVTGDVLPGTWPNLGDISVVAQKLIDNEGSLVAKALPLDPPPTEKVGAPALTISQKALMAASVQPSNVTGLFAGRDQIEFDRIIAMGAPQGQRSEQFHRAVGLAKRIGLSPEATEEMMRANPNGIARKYLAPLDRLNAEVSRCWGKVDDGAVTVLGFTENVATSPSHAPEPLVLRAKPLKLVSASAIAPRDWIYGNHLVRRFVSCTVAPGGVGKSSLVMVEAMAMASGKPLLGYKPTRPMNVWVWNLEDPQEELDRRFAAIAKHYGLAQGDFEGRLFVNSGRDYPLCVAHQIRGEIVVTPDLQAMAEEMLTKQIDVVSVDPFISSHKVSENDNVAVDTVVKAWVRLADECNAAVELVHHTRKTKDGDTEVTAESGRGAKALVDASRDTRVVNRMSEREAKSFGVEDNHRSYFRTYSDKHNLAPPADESDWYHLTSVDLENGRDGMRSDHIGVPVRWEQPSALDGIGWDTVDAILTDIDIGMVDDEGKPTGALYSFSRAGNSRRWVGQLVMDKAQIEEPEAAKRVVTAWKANGVLVEATYRDRDGRDKNGIKINKAIWAEMKKATGVTNAK